MKLLLLSLLVLGAPASSTQQQQQGQNEQVVKVYSEDGTGKSRTFKNYIPKLEEQDIDNLISSANVTGIWIFYEHVHYAGQSFMARGINKLVTMPSYIDNKVSSIRYAGSLHNFNASALSLYSGEIYTGTDFLTETDLDTLTGLQDRVGSLIITGPEPWSLYPNKNFEGVKTCLYTDSVSEGHGKSFNMAAFALLKDTGIKGNIIGSVKKGCRTAK